MFDWNSSESEILINPRYPKDEIDRIFGAVKGFDFEGSIWLRSSGTESDALGIKLVHLTREGILLAAKSVNQWLRVNEDDCWINPLPNFHIGGLSISARCFVAGAKSVDFSEGWDPIRFCEFANNHEATIASLVPTQVFDLVTKKCVCPASLSRILVGGGRLSEKLYTEAKALGWPLLISYGMTESSAALAISELSSIKEKELPEMYLLPHFKSKTEDGRSLFFSQSLFEGFLIIGDRVQYLPREEWYQPDDILEINDGQVIVHGRESSLVKILGETVNIEKLEIQISERIGRRVAVQPLENERRGYDLKLWVEAEPVDFSLDRINKSLMPFERLSQVVSIEKFPETDLGKIKKSLLFNVGE